MLGSGDNSGIIAFLIGITILVFVGIGLSLIAENRISFSRSRIGLEEKISIDAARIVELRTKVEHLDQRWRDTGESRQLQSASLHQALAKQRKATAAIEAAGAEITDLRQAVTRVEKAFTNYRIRYRRQARNDCVGTSVPSLEIAGGRVYHEVEITGVEKAGLRIRHARGLATIRFADMSAEWKERLQWNRGDEAPPPPPGPPAETSPAGPDEPSPAVKLDPDTGTEADPDTGTEADLESLRAEFIDTRDRLLEARRLAAEAASNRLSQKRSVPGSLETWAEREQRFTAMANRIRVEFSKARSRLAAAKPSDPLLRTKLR